MSPSLRLLRNLGIGVFAGLVVLYLVLVAVLYIEQDALEYPGAHPGAPSDPATFASAGVTDVRIKTPDGETLDGWYAPPRFGHMVILYFHGNDGTIGDSRWRYVRLLAEGVGFLAIDYRGFGQSTGHVSERGLLTDGVAAYDWLRAKGFQPNDIVIHGHSLGTGVAIYLATQRPARALILEAPFTAAVDVAAHNWWFVPVSLLMNDQYLSRDRIRDVHMSVLIAHGDADRVIPFQEGVDLYKLANAPKTFVRMHGSDHSTLTRDGVYTCYWRFLGLPYDTADSGVCGTL